MRTPVLRVILAFVLVLAPTSVQAQSLQDVLNELFVFGGGDDPLFLVGTAGQEATAVHGEHFIPASSEANSALINFFNSAIAANISNFPLSATVASKTVRFVDGVPTPTSQSFGPIFAERAQTVGRGRFNAGFNYSRLSFSTIRGIDLDDVQLNFVHQNSDFPGCDEAFLADCTLYGVPVFENDVIGLTLDVNVDVNLFAFFGTFGVTDWFDLSVAIPIVDISLQGSSLASVTPFFDPPFHFFGGTRDNPVLQAESQAFGDASGIGDIAVRAKLLLVSGENWDLGVLGEARAPTGDEDDFLGTGEWEAGGLAIISGTFADFSPHANIGYQYRGSDLDQDEVKLVAGFDQRVTDWATLAVDFLGNFKVGDEELAFPDPVQYEAPFERTLELTNIPSVRDDRLDGSLGFKFQTQGGLIIVTNVLIPLNDGGLRSGLIPTLGIEYTI